MQKMKLLAMLTAMALLLSGCAMIARDEKTDLGREVIRVGDTVYTKGEVLDEVAYSMDYMQMLYAMYGMTYDVTDPEIVRGTQEAVVNKMAEQAVMVEKARQLGLDQLTADEQARLERAAENTWQEYRDSVYFELSLPEDVTEAEAEAAIDKVCAAEGTSYETVRQKELLSLMNEKLQAWAIRDVTVSEEDVRAAYDAAVAADVEKCAANPSYYGMALLNGGRVCYCPEGYRYVKQILIQYSDEDTAAMRNAEIALNTAEEGADTAALTAALEEARAAALARIDAEADEVLARLAAGEDWDALSAQFNDDPGMMSGAEFASTGYPVCEGFEQFDPVFVEAAMALQNVGDWSDKALGSYGYYIIQYTAGAIEGAVSYETARSVFAEELLAARQDAAYREAVQAWVSEMDVKINMGVLRD